MRKTGSGADMSHSCTRSGLDVDIFRSNRLILVRLIIFLIDVYAFSASLSFFLIFELPSFSWLWLPPFGSLVLVYSSWSYINLIIEFYSNLSKISFISCGIYSYSCMSASLRTTSYSISSSLVWSFLSFFSACFSIRLFYLFCRKKVKLVSAQPNSKYKLTRFRRSFRNCFYFSISLLSFSCFGSRICAFKPMISSKLLLYKI